MNESVESEARIVLDIEAPEPATEAEIASLPSPAYLYHLSPRSYCASCRDYRPNTYDGKCAFCTGRMGEVDPGWWYLVDEAEAAQVMA
jgi:hypothetical protein